MSVNKNSPGPELTGLSMKSFQFLLALILAVGGVVGGYAATLYGVKVDLAGKADMSATMEIEKRLERIEVLIQEKLLTRQEFHDFEHELDNRLDAIEASVETP